MPFDNLDFLMNCVSISCKMSILYFLSFSDKFWTKSIEVLFSLILNFLF
jgi:hypothetical protein